LYIGATCAIIKKKGDTMKTRFVTTLEPETIKQLKLLAVNMGINVNDLIKLMVDKMKGGK